MALQVWNGFAQDTAGNVLESPTVEVRDETDNSLVSLFEDRAGATALGNPYTAPATGQIAFYVLPGRYKITATKGAETITFRNELVGYEPAELVPTVATLAELLSASTDTDWNVKSYFTGWAAYLDEPLGGGTFYWDATRAKSEHNGGTIISPTVPWDGNTGSSHTDFLNGVGETDGAGSGCWVRGLNDGGVFIEYFGAIPDSSVDVRYAIQAGMNYINSIGGGVLSAGEGEFLLSSKDPTTKIIVELRSGVSLIGAGAATSFKVADGLISTDGYQVFRANGEVISDATFSDFEINFNGGNNLYPSGLPGGFCHGISAKAVNGAAAPNNIRIERVRFKDNPGSQSVVLSASDDLSVFPEGCWVQDNIFVNSGPAISGNTHMTDHSCIYAQGKRIHIKGNVLVNDSLISSDTVSAIEAHTRESIISGNIAKNFTAFMNLASQTTPCTDNNVQNNVAINVDIGVYMWNGISGVTAGVFKRNNIKNNTIILSDQSSAPYGGIVPSTLEGVMSEVSITGNNIYQAGNVSGNGKNPRGIFLAWAEHCKVDGNNLRNLAGRGIEVSNFGTGRVVRRISISGNNISDVGLGGVSGHDQAILARGVNASLVVFDVKIHSNQITEDYGSAVEIDGYVNGPNIQNNAIKTSDLNPIKFTNFNASNIVEENNWVEEASAMPSSGFYLRGKVIKNNIASEVGTSPNKYIIHGWRRLTNGSAHVNGTDWVPMKVFTGN